jgi:hypothetical protein
VSELSQEKCFVTTEMPPIIPRTKPISSMINKLLVYGRSRLAKDIKKAQGTFRSYPKFDFREFSY